MKKIIVISIIFSFGALVSANVLQIDTITVLKHYELDEVHIRKYLPLGGMERLPDVKNNIIYTGKKTELIRLNRINADLSTNNARQVFAKIPGLSIWENDGSGIQLGVATRGLNPNRSWEFNVRQNNYDISSEIFGYPEAYYTPPMEAVEKIEIIRGAASLQMGPQFGGLLNFHIKKGHPHKPISFETRQTLGSYGLFNTFNAVGGTINKFSYYAFLHHRTAEGWRSNSRYSIYTGYLSANYWLTNKINIGLEYTRMDYKSQQPGGLTDVMFEQNHRQSLRKRNWFGTPWNVVALNFNYEISSQVHLQIKSFATIAERNSVGFVRPVTIPDAVNPATLQYDQRQVDRDFYENYGTEARIGVRYKFLGKDNFFAGGVRAYIGNTGRDQLGAGTNGNDFDLSLTNPQYGRSLDFRTENFSAFAENIFQISERLKIVPGIRIEFIENHSKGYINTTVTGVLPNERRIRQIVLYGIGGEFELTESTFLYGNYSMAYRPVTFAELTPSATTDIIDPELKDASGFNADFGYRGSIKNYLNFDVGVFYMHYNNRIGNVLQNGTPFRTNIGTSVSKGIESYIEINPVNIFTDNSRFGNISFFAANSFISAEYVKWNNPAISIEGKRVENAPKYIHRMGATYTFNGFSATFLYISIGDVFTDAANTEAPNAAGSIGKIPAYRLMDATFSYRFMNRFNLSAGVNNIADVKYATRRAGGYPGPGIMPGNGRTFFVSLGAKF